MRKFEVVRDEFRKHKGDIKLPTRSDKGSAGYDFYTQEAIEIKPGETAYIHTDVKIAMEEDEVMFLFVRSSTGIKRKLMLATGVSVIDSTFYGNPENDGNLMVVLKNVGTETQSFGKHERIVQGVFCKYLTVDDDAPLNSTRTGGIGSSGK